MTDPRGADDAPDPPIDAIDFSFRTDTPHGAGGPTTRLVVAGQDLTRFARRVNFTADVHSLNTVELELYAGRGFELIAPLSVVYIAIYPLPGVRLVEDRVPDRVIYRVVPEDSDL
jgi:hypothetical protein